jgi:exonuclease SbcC
MKILAIRLKNLASLAGPFELDFTAEPLASAGLFAITGPPARAKARCWTPCAWRCSARFPG